ncbi:RICIN domain-containing protein [Kitasatospora sp. NPDC059146]|uniref:RICIN domain-containing protein n=1 Tax=unclassified Kitasatospora TaxID=2633591 RepID=UPI0036CDC985
MSAVQNIESPLRRTRRAAAAGAVAVAALAATLVAGSPAHAAGYDGILRSWAQGNCLDIKPGSTSVYTSPCVTGDNWQRWRLESAGADGAVTVVNDQTSLCLDIPPGSWNGSTGALYVSTCVFGDRWQQWQTSSMVRPDGNLAVNFRNQAVQACLDANQPQNLPFINSRCYYGGYQDWKPGF